MKLRRKIAVVLVAASVAGVLCAFFLSRPDDSARKAVEETRRALRQQGFKVDLTEFNFSTSDELRARARALTNASSTPRIREDYARRAALQQNMPDLMEAVGSNSAVVIWKENKLPDRSGRDLWPTLRELLNADRDVLEAACQATLSGPIRFDLDASRGT